MKRYLARSAACCSTIVLLLFVLILSTSSFVIDAAAAVVVGFIDALLVRCESWLRARIGGAGGGNGRRPWLAPLPHLLVSCIDTSMLLLLLLLFDFV